MGPLKQLSIMPAINVGSADIGQFSPIAVTGARLSDENKNRRRLLLEVESLDSYGTSDLTYMPQIGFNLEGRVAQNRQGTVTFDFSMPLLAACEGVSLASTDLLVAERGQARLQKLDNAHSGIFGIYRSLREQSQKNGWRLHVVTPVEGALYAELTASLSSPAEMVDAPATANAKLLIHDSANAGELKDGPTCKISNRWKDVSLSSGKRVRIELDRHYGELSLIAAECP